MRCTSAIVGVVLVAFAVAAAEAKRSVTLDDLEGVAAHEAVIGTTLAVSANGRFVAIERGHRLSVVEVRSGQIVRDLGEGIAPIWAPRGERLGFYSSRSGTLQIWVWDGNGEARQVTDFPSGIDADPTTRITGAATDALRLSWSPDGQSVVFACRVEHALSRQPPEGAPLVLTNTTADELTFSGVFAEPSPKDGIVEIKDGRTWGYRAPKKGQILFSQLFVVNVRTRISTQITQDSRSYFDPDWSADGRWVAFAATGITAEGEDDTGTRGWDSIRISSKEGEIIVLNIATLERRVLATGSEVKHSPRWSPNGLRVAYLASPTIFEDPAIHVVRLNDRHEETGLRLDRKIRTYAWAGTSDFLVSYYDGGSKLTRFHPGSRTVANVDASVRWPAGVWSRSANGVIAWVEGYDGSGVWVLEPGAKKPVLVVDVNPATQDLDLGGVETVTWRTQRGDTLEGKVLYPPDYQPGRKYPAIIDVYPLGGGSLWMHPMDGNQTWAAAGYVVFKPMPRAPHVWMNCSKSTDFCRASKGPGAWDVMVDDVMTGIDALIQRGIIDPNRMCIYGHSNGGTTVDYLVTRTDRFKCAIAVAGGYSDWVWPAFLSTDDAVTTVAGVAPWQDPDAYIKLSPAFYVNKVKTPMLLAAGDEDGGFLLGTIRMYCALRQAGADVTLLRYPGQGHIFTGAAMRDFWQRQMDFFAHYLGSSK